MAEISDMPTLPINYIFSNPNCNQHLVVEESVIQHLRNHCQTTGPEVGGQLFGKVEEGRVIVSFASGPHAEKKRSKFLFVPCRLRERKEIYKLFKLGFHFLGDWHTHPEQNPSPSTLDIDSMRDCFIRSRHEHQAFILIIVGNGSESNSLWVSLHNKTDFVRLLPLNQSQAAD